MFKEKELRKKRIWIKKRERERERENDRDSCVKRSVSEVLPC